MKIFISTIAIFTLTLSIKTATAGVVEPYGIQKDSLSEKAPSKALYSKEQLDTANPCLDDIAMKNTTTEQQLFSVSATSIKHRVNRDKKRRPIGLKSNLLYWMAATPNIAAEFYLSNRLSLNTEIDFAWWSSYTTQFYWQIFAISPELRYWFCSTRPFQGHYAGAYVSGGFYDIMFKPLTSNKGYLGEFFVSAGLSYGYMFPIGKYFSLEAGIGIGFMTTNYQEYRWGCSGYMRTDTKRTVWVGPTKINLTLVWRIPR